MSDIKKILIAGAVIVAALALSFMVGERHAQKRLISLQKEIKDTLFIYDTIVSNDPIFVTKIKVDSIPYPVPVRDTLWKTDTIWLQKEQVMWQDSLSRVYASGVSVEIDSVLHFVSTKVITKERDVMVKVKPKWSIGVHAGYGAFNNNGQIATSPYIGVGVSYNLFSW